MAETIQDAWDAATIQIVKRIEQYTGMEAGGKNGNLFISHFPPAYNAAAVFLGGGNDVTPWLAATEHPTAIKMTGRVEFRFEELRDARKFSADLMAALPIRKTGIIVDAQPTGLPNPEGRYYRLHDGHKQEDPVLLFGGEMPMTVVFRVGSRF